MSTTEKQAMPVKNRTSGLNARWCFVIAAGLVVLAGVVHVVARLVWYVTAPLSSGLTTDQLLNLKLFDYEPASLWHDGVSTHFVALLFIAADLWLIWIVLNVLQFFTGRVRNWANHRANDSLCDMESAGLGSYIFLAIASGIAGIIIREEWDYAVVLIMLTN